MVLAVLIIIDSLSTAAYPSVKLVKAIALKESGNNDKAVGDKHLAKRAYGHLQVRQTALDDVNRKFGTNYKAAECLGNRELSEWVCREYINMYATEKAIGQAPSEEQMSRIWNGGPTGFRKKSTVGYWAKVKKILSELSGA
jgi:hypothetical protein